MTRRRRSLAVAVAVGLLAFTGAASASAATQVGQTFDPTGGAFCTAPSTTLQSGSPGGKYRAPTAGVITSWSFQAGTQPPRAKLKVGRFAGGDDFTIVGESALKLPTPTFLNTFPARIPVHRADVIGLFVDTNGLCGRVASGFLDHFRGDDTPPGTKATFTQEGNFQFDISAALEPDADGDEFGDETQDACPTDASTHGPCPDRSSPETTIDEGPKKRGKRRKAKFEFSSNEAGSTFECELDKKDFAACEAPFSKKVKRGRKHTFKVRATDGAGNVDATPAKFRWKVKKRK